MTSTPAPHLSHLPRPTALPQLPPSVTVTDGAGGLPVVRVATALATGEVYLQGAHVTAWQPAGTDPVIWLSAAAQFRPGTAIRGGVPLCFPWFGAGRTPGLTPAHGFARTAPWRLTGAADDAGTVTLTFTLTHDDVAGAPGTEHWPFAFDARYTVTFGAELTLALTVRNTGVETFSFEEALHTYLAVTDVRTARVEGLDGAQYLDKTAAADAAAVTQHGPVTFSGATDRVYLRGAPLTLVDPGARAVTVTPTGAADTVVWNPWAERAAAMSDLGDEEWPTMVCLEAANALDDAVSLEPGGAHTVTVGYGVGPVGR